MLASFLKKKYINKFYCFTNICKLNESSNKMDEQFFQKKIKLQDLFISILSLIRRMSTSLAFQISYVRALSV